MRNLRLLAVISLASSCVIAASSAEASFGFCSEPRAPSITFLSKPNKPYCATSGKGCDRWEIDSYKTDLKRYFDRLQEYVDDVDVYRKKAYEYAECMAKLD